MPLVVDVKLMIEGVILEFRNEPRDIDYGQTILPTADRCSLVLGRSTGQSGP